MQRVRAGSIAYQERSMRLLLLPAILRACRLDADLPSPERRHYRDVPQFKIIVIFSLVTTGNGIRERCKRHRRETPNHLLRKRRDLHQEN
jgi:hypothetical protein